MNHISRYFTIIILVVSFSCSTDNRGVSVSSGEKIAVPLTEQKAEGNIERKLIKEGKVDFETDDISLTRESIFETVNKYKGYIASDQEFKSVGSKSNTIIIRVPADNFDILLSEATVGIDKFDRREITVNDVTEEFLDIQVRLKTKKQLEQRYIELLKKANTVTEILEIEKQIGQLRSEIESIEGQLKFLDNKVSLSTLTLTFYQSIPSETKIGGKFISEFKNGWDNLISFFIVMTSFWPFILIIVGLVFFIRKSRSKASK